MGEPVIVDSAGQTNTGHVRRSNEDSYLMREPLFMVADGMGGAAAGEIASTICAEAFAEIDLIRTEGEDALRRAIETANTRIRERALAEPAISGMGTTVAAALFGKNGQIAFANVGDSRAYLLRGGTLRRLSEDHSIVAELVAAGQITEEEAERHPQRSVITRALGAEPTVEVDSFSLTPEPADVIMLCTDGLTTMVSEDTIAQLLGEQWPAEEAVHGLIGAALAGGGEDNVTALVFRVGEQETDEETTLSSEPRILIGDPDLEPERDGGGGNVSWRRLALVSLAVAAVVAALLVGTIIGLRESHFIGADQDTGHVEIYQGVPIELFAGVKLYHAVHVSPLMYASLDAATRRQLFDHQLRSYDGALKALAQAESGG